LAASTQVGRKNLNTQYVGGRRPLNDVDTEILSVLPGASDYGPRCARVIGAKTANVPVMDAHFRNDSGKILKKPD
jgi:hypothetical protein